MELDCCRPLRERTPWLHNHSVVLRTLLWVPSVSCFLKEFRGEREKKKREKEREKRWEREREKKREEERERGAFKMQWDKTMWSFIYRGELETGASHNCGAAFCERDLESWEMGITKNNSLFRKRTVIKPFPCLVRGKDNSRKCNGEIKFYFVKRHFGFFFCSSEIISKLKSGIF